MTTLESRTIRTALERILAGEDRAEVERDYGWESGTLEPMNKAAQLMADSNEAYAACQAQAHGEIDRWKRMVEEAERRYHDVLVQRNVLADRAIKAEARLDGLGKETP